MGGFRRKASFAGILVKGGADAKAQGRAIEDGDHDPAVALVVDKAFTRVEVAAPQVGEGSDFGPTLQEVPGATRVRAAIIPVRRPGGLGPWCACWCYGLHLLTLDTTDPGQSIS